jgi:hypothetical protein
MILLKSKTTGKPQYVTDEVYQMMVDSRRHLKFEVIDKDIDFTPPDSPEIVEKKNVQVAESAPVSYKPKKIKKESQNND